LQNDEELKRIAHIVADCKLAMSAAKQEKKRLAKNLIDKNNKIDNKKHQLQKLQDTQNSYLSVSQTAGYKKDYTGRRQNYQSSQNMVNRIKMVKKEIRLLQEERSEIVKDQLIARQIFQTKQNEYNLASDEYSFLDKIIKKDRQKIEWTEIARSAGVPDCYLDQVWKITKTRTNSINIYFGPKEKDGENDEHGHYCKSPKGFVYYKRNPYEPHGQQNYLRCNPETAKLISLAENTVRHCPNDVVFNSKRREIRYDDDIIKIKATAGFSTIHKKVVHDFIITHREIFPNQILHVILSCDGELLFCKLEPKE
jgi:D-Tyr-tRNAtyr deacylase